MLSPGTRHQVTFSTPEAAGTFPIEFQGVSGTLSHSASATLTVTPQPNPYLVSASYYPWYIPANWDYTECINGIVRGQLIPPELPMLGEYDSQDQDVVTQQIAWSAAAWTFFETRFQRLVIDLLVGKSVPCRMSERAPDYRRQQRQHDPIHHRKTALRHWTARGLANRGIMPFCIISGFA